MEDEFIDIVTEDLKITNTCLKSDAHKNGWLHACIHIWFYTDQGEILIQKRAKNKDAFPNLWDVSVAGHISTGEDASLAAIREAKEEVGIKILEKDLFKIGMFKEKFEHKKDFIDNEIHHIYLCKLTDNIGHLKLQKEEVSEIKLISLKRFRVEFAKSDFKNNFVPHYSEYYNFIFSKIEEQISCI